MIRDVVSMTSEEFQRDVAEYDRIRRTHSWLYGHNYVKCVLCGARSSSKEGRTECPGFGLGA